MLGYFYPGVSETIMRFQSKQEAYFYTLHLIEKMTEAVPIDRKIWLIDEIRILIENHEQDSSKVALLLETLAVEKKTDGEALHLLSAALKDPNSFFPASLYQKWQNELARRLESVLYIELVQNPTKKMMDAVKKTSCYIAIIIHHLSCDDEKRLLDFMNRKYQGLSFGNVENFSTKEDVLAFLMRCDRTQLIEILYVHFIVASQFGREARICGSEFSSLLHKIANRSMYRSSYYLDRGRRGELHSRSTSQMGIGTCENSIVSMGLPAHQSRWISDAKVQQPNFASAYVQSLLNQETPYVAGPSGMTSVFIGMLIACGKKFSIEEKRSYLLCVAAYLVSGGYHSLHEILGPVAYCLAEYNLLPGYQTNIPSDKNPVISAPSYHYFHALIAARDPDFCDRRNVAWAKMSQFFDELYLPTTRHLVQNSIFFQGDQTLFAASDSALASKDVRADGSPVDAAASSFAMTCRDL